MELDALKKELGQKLAAPGREWTARELGQMLRRETGSVVRKLRRSLFLELSLTLLFTVTCAVALMTWSQPAYQNFLVGCMVAGGLMSAWLLVLIGRTKIETAALPVKQNLIATHRLLRQFIRSYLWLATGLTPLCIMVAFWLTYQNPAAAAKPIRWDVFGYLFAGAVILSIATYFFTRWYLRSLYGKYLDELQEVISEMEEDTSH